MSKLRLFNGMIGHAAKNRSVLFVLRIYGPHSAFDDLRWLHLSLHGERWRRKACLVVASSTSFVLPLGAKAQSLRCARRKSPWGTPPLPTEPSLLGFGGAPVGDPLESPELMLTVSRTYFVPTTFPQGDFLRARNGACDAIKSRMACTSALLPCALRAAVPRSR